MVGCRPDSSHTEQALSLVGWQRRGMELLDIPMQACSRLAGVAASSGFHGAVQNTQIARSPRQLWALHALAGRAGWALHRAGTSCSLLLSLTFMLPRMGHAAETTAATRTQDIGRFSEQRSGCALPSARAASVCWLSTPRSCLSVRHQLLTTSCMLVPHCSICVHVKHALAAMPASQQPEYACNSGPTRQHTARWNAPSCALPAHECASAGRADQGGRPWRWHG